MRQEKSLRIGVHHADAVVWEPVYRTHLADVRRRERRLPQRPDHVRFDVVRAVKRRRFPRELISPLDLRRERERVQLCTLSFTGNAFM